MLASLPLLLGLVAPALDAPAELRGGWKLVSVEVNGKVDAIGFGQPRIAIDGDTVRYGGEDFARLVADASVEPKMFDLRVLNSSREYEGIYAVDKETLKVCLNRRTDGVKERPHRLSTGGKDDWRLLTFRRVGPGEGGEADGLRGYVGMALRFDGDRNELVVEVVLDGSPANKANLKKGDVVLKLGDETPGGLVPAVEAVRRARPGSTLAMVVRREGKEKEIPVKVGFVPFSLLAQLD